MTCDFACPSSFQLLEQISSDRCACRSAGFVASPGPVRPGEPPRPLPRIAARSCARPGREGPRPAARRQGRLHHLLRPAGRLADRAVGHQRSTPDCRHLPVSSATGRRARGNDSQLGSRPLTTLRRGGRPGRPLPPLRRHPLQGRRRGWTRTGRRVGANAWAMASSYFDGTAAP
jgi:hypothetical protein